MPQPTHPQVLVVGNPYSGRRSNARRVEKLVAELAGRGVTVQTVWDREQRRALLARPGLAATCRCVVVAGGDGTVGDVINEGPGLPLAVVPLGTENLISKRFGFFAPVAALAAGIVRGRHHCIDLGLARSLAAPAATGNGRRFSLMLTAGLDADVVHRLAQWRAAGERLRRVSYASYVQPICGAFTQYGYAPIQIEADGQRASGTSIMVFNLPCYGFNLGFGHGAASDDGMLDWIAFSGVGVGPALSYLAAVARGSHRRRKDVQHGRARRIRLTSSTPVPLQVDGDPLGCTPVELEAVPRALRIVDVR